MIKTCRLLFKLTPFPLQKWNQSLPQPHSKGENTTLRTGSQRVLVAQRGNHSQTTEMQRPRINHHSPCVRKPPSTHITAHGLQEVDWGHHCEVFPGPLSLTAFPGRDWSVQGSELTYCSAFLIGSLRTGACVSTTSPIPVPQPSLEAAAQPRGAQ